MWQQQIEDCLKNNRHRLKGIPVVLISTAKYKPPYWYWQKYFELRKDRNE